MSTNQQKENASRSSLSSSDEESDGWIPDYVVLEKMEEKYGS